VNVLEKIDTFYINLWIYAYTYIAIYCNILFIYDVTKIGNVHFDDTLIVNIIYTSAYIVLCGEGGSLIDKKPHNLQGTTLTSRMQSCSTNLTWKHDKSWYISYTWE